MKNKRARTKNILMFLASLSVIFASNITWSYFQLPAIAQTQNNRKVEADKLQKQGEQQLEAGQYVLGTETLERAMRIYQGIGDKETYQKMLERIVLIYISRGLQDMNKLKLLAEELNKLDSENSQAENPEFKLENEVEELVVQGFNSQQQKFFEQALSKAKANGGQKEEILALKAFGTFYLYRGNYNDALTKLKEAERLSAARYKGKDDEAAIAAYYNFNKLSNNSAESVKLGKTYMEIVQYRIPILLLLCETYLQQNNPKESLIHFKKASAIATEIYKGESKQNLQLGISLFVDPSLYLSRAYYSLGKYDLTLDYARKAIARGEYLQKHRPIEPLYFPVPTSGDSGNGHGHVLAGIALEKQGKLEQAEQELKQAIQIFETIRRKSTHQANIKHNLDLFNNQVRASYILQRILLAQNKSGEALAASESGRSRILLETATVPKNLSLEEKIDALIDAQYTPESICKDMDRFYGCDGEALIQEKKQDYLDDARKDPTVLDMLTGGSPSNTALSNIQPPNVEQLKQIARSQQKTIVEYSIISETTYFHPQAIFHNNYGVNRNAFPGKEEKLVIWVIKPTGEIQTRQIDLKNKNINFKELVANTRVSMGLERSMAVFSKEGSILNPSAIQTKNNLKKLHQLLIEPIADLLPNDPEAKVVFVPHKQLFLVPFAVLIDSNDKYLIEKHTIITAPSIQALKVTHEKQQKLPKNSKLAVVVGNPTMPSIPTSDNKPTEQLSNLEGAEEEGRQVAQRLNTQFLTGNKATKATVLKQLPNARYIHLATHGLLEDYAGFGIPGAIALAPSGNDNGFLTSSEIQELNLKAELAVLSACDTGRGDITGDGVVGLSRALIVAGVPSVVVSLWAVPDAPTAELMVEFYRNFQEGKLDKAQALRQAMLKMMKEGNNRDNPVKWGAFSLIGQAG
ncbi:MAG: CHAT domain-containing protein [Richelia sp. RM1_1_1]|nr:CHAT domain-containing protein [Richelia sp. RM1_1_1]